MEQEQLLYLAIPILAFLVDAILGDPNSNYHPVVLIGRVISFYEKLLRNPSHNPSESILRGGILVVATLVTVVGLCGFLLYRAYLISYYAFIGLSVFYLWASISPHSLAKAGNEIRHLLLEGNIEKGRERVGWIVGRDTKELDEGEITRATVETIAENTVDGIVSPLCFFLLMGPLGAVLYRTVNTMDSMIAYKNDTYLYFGRVAAYVDDICNYIPARITSALFIVSAYLLSFDGKGAYAMVRRDAHKHPSPNGGYAEAAVAGALHIRLGGYNTYGSRKTFRAYMGDAIEALSAKHIKETIHLMYAVTGFTILIMTTCLVLGRFYL